MKTVDMVRFRGSGLGLELGKRRAMPDSVLAAFPRKQKIAVSVREYPYVGGLPGARKPASQALNRQSADNQQF
ncbi:hypothetical protein [Polaromonas sp. DSP2-3-2b2]|uniref:hypothetical protein n=1 Tax=Polaromonas sp. DSP2-3-2b2 TaxID=2804662 RepID=UPI003CF73823